MARPTHFETVQKHRAIKHAVSEVNPLKSRLLTIHADLRRVPGCARRADELDRIIARLEAWQNKQ